jgi:hypothetical protein
MLDREIAWRIFAQEFNKSDYIYTTGEDQAPHYLITPTGAKCNRLFAAGVITEAENIGYENDLWRARIADPTGVFTIYAGQYQPEAAIFLANVEIPSFITVVGKARTYEPGDGHIYTSIRPEEINTTDEYTRDEWILETAKKTLKRIDTTRLALASNLQSKELINYLQTHNIQKELAEGISLAITHYSELEQYLDELENTVYEAIKTILPEQKNKITTQQTPPAPTPPEDTRPIPQQPQAKETPEKQETITDPKEYIANIMEMLDTGKGAQYSDIIEAAQKASITPEQLEEIIKELMSEGRCYEPKIGVLRIV